MIQSLESSPRQHCDLVVRNGCLLTLDGGNRIFDPGAVAIAGTSVVAVGPETEILTNYSALQVLDARGGVIHPGLIDAHNHIVHGTSRGVFGSGRPTRADISFADWKAGVTPEDECVATQLAGLEMLRAGFTSFVEPGTAFDTDAIAAGADSVGVRTFLAAPYIWDEVEVMRALPGLESESLYRRAPPDRDRCLSELGRELRWNSNPDSRIHGYVSVYGLGTASDTLLQAGKSAADAAGVAFQQHEGYTPAASAADRARLSHSRIRHLTDLGVLDKHSTLIHMYVMEDGDLEILAGQGVCVVSCPVAYMELAISDQVRWNVPVLMEQGIPVAFGTDGARSCVIGDAMHCGFLLAASAGVRIPPDKLLRMQTSEAARSVAMSDRLGSLEPGKRADLVIRRADTPELHPGINPVHQVALLGRTGTVDTVIVNGEMVLRSGRSCRVDEGRIAEESRRSVRERMQRLGLA